MTSGSTDARRPFRFGVVIDTRSVDRRAFLDLAQRVEAAGFSTLLGTDHVGRWSSLLLLGAAAEATTKLRIGTYVLNADLRHPVLLAQDLATLDLLSEGRLEIGLGAGWMRADYEALGASFPSGGSRLARLRTAVEVMRQALEHGRVHASSGDGQAASPISMPPSTQRPMPPLLIGGGGPQLLRFAARQADIVSINPRSTAEGAMDPTDVTPAAMDEKVGWIKAAAGDRRDELELNANLFGIGVTHETAHGPAAAIVPYLTPEELAASPHFLPADPSEIAERLEEGRERWGLSYVVVRQAELPTVEPVVAALAGR